MRMRPNHLLCVFEDSLDAGRRIARRVNNAVWGHRMVNRANRVVADVDHTGEWYRYYMYATGKNIPDIMYQNTSTGVDTYRIIADHLGSLRSVVKLNSTFHAMIAQSMEYDEWGNVIQDPLGFSGGIPLLYGYVGGDPINKLARCGLGAGEPCFSASDAVWAAVYENNPLAADVMDCSGGCRTRGCVSATRDN